MKGPIQQDSMSRCEPPSFYETIRNPNARPLPPKPIIETRDTIETSPQQRFNQLSERFKTSGLRLPHESFVAVAQVGKYMFLAIMVPTYLCVYGIPRWLLMNLLPQLFAGLAQHTFKIGRFASDLSKQMTDVMKGALKQLIGDALRLSSQQTKQLWQHIMAGPIAIGAHLAKTWHALGHKLSEFTKMATHPVSELYQKIAHFSETIHDKIKTKAHELSDSAKHHVQQLSQSINNQVIIPMINFFSQPITYTTQWTKTLAQRLASTASDAKDSIKEKLKEMLDPLSRAAKAVTEQIKQIAQAVFSPIITWGQIALEASMRRMQEAWEKVSKPATKIAEGVRDKVNQIQTSIIQFFNSALVAIPSALLYPIKWIKKRMPNWKQNPSQQQKGLIYRSKEFFRKGKDKIVLATKRGALLASKLVRQLLKQLIQKAKLLLGKFKQELIALPNKIKRGIQRLARATRKTARRLASELYLYMVWLWTLCCLGMFLVRQLTDKFILWLSDPESEDSF